MPKTVEDELLKTVVRFINDGFGKERGNRLTDLVDSFRYYEAISCLGNRPHWLELN